MSLVLDVGHLLQHQVLDLGLGHTLVRVARLGVHQERVAGLERFAPPADRPGAPPVPRRAATADERAGTTAFGARVRTPLAGCRPHPCSRSRRPPPRSALRRVGRSAPAQTLDVHRRRHGDPHLAARGEHIHRVIVVSGDEHAVAARQVGAKPRSTSSRSANSWLRASRRVSTSLLLRSVSWLTRSLRLGEPLLQHSILPGRVGELATEQRHFFLEETDLTRLFARRVLRGSGSACL